MSDPGATQGGARRTLAAIVFTDVVDFSARANRDEERTLRLVQRDLALLRAVCQRCEGRVLKGTGDGLLMYFDSAVQAVACALQAQQAVAEQAKDLPAEEVLQHRIGIHLGDVFVSEGDVMGDGVNIAARLQTEAPPGGICVSQTVYEVVKNRLSVKATYLGPRELKNIREAVPIYQILLDAAGAAAADPQAARHIAAWQRVAVIAVLAVLALAVVLGAVLFRGGFAGGPGATSGPAGNGIGRAPGPAAGAPAAVSPAAAVAGVPPADPPAAPSSAPAVAIAPAGHEPGTPPEVVTDVVDPLAAATASGPAEAATASRPPDGPDAPPVATAPADADLAQAATASAPAPLAAADDAPPAASQASVTPADPQAGTAGPADPQTADPQPGEPGVEQPPARPPDPVEARRAEIDAARAQYWPGYDFAGMARWLEREGLSGTEVGERYRKLRRLRTSLEADLGATTRAEPLVVEYEDDEGRHTIRAYAAADGRIVLDRDGARQTLDLGQIPPPVMTQLVSAWVRTQPSRELREAAALFAEETEELAGPAEP